MRVENPFELILKKVLDIWDLNFGSIEKSSSDAMLEDLIRIFVPHI
jgi:hypothetical protein